MNTKELKTNADLILFAGAVASVASATGELDTLAKSLKKAGVKFGKRVKTCPNRATLQDVLAERGLSGRTLTNAVAAAIIAVENGKWLGMNPSRAKEKTAGASAPAQSKTDEKKLALLLAGLDKNPAFKGFLAQLDAAQANAFLAASAAYQTANK